MLPNLSPNSFHTLKTKHSNAWAYKVNNAWVYGVNSYPNHHNDHRCQEKAGVDHIGRKWEERGISKIEPLTHDN